MINKCEFLLNKWAICTMMNRRLPSYEKQTNCKKHHEKFMKECYEKVRKEEKDKIFKASVFSAL